VAQGSHPQGALHTGNVADDLATAAGPFEVVVVSPARPIYDGMARFVTVETLRGQLGVWPRHADLVAALGVGPLRIGKPGGGEDRFAIRGGFLKVGGRKVTVLVDQAVPADQVDAAAAREHLDQTLAALRHPKSDEEFTELLTERAWWQTQIRVAS